MPGGSLGALKPNKGTLVQMYVQTSPVPLVSLRSSFLEMHLVVILVRKHHQIPHVLSTHVVGESQAIVSIFKGNVFVIEVVVIPKGYPRCIKIQVVMSFECCD